MMAALQAFYGGDVEGCREWPARYVVETGARHVILRFGALTGHRAALDLAAERLLPALRSDASATVAPAG